MKSGQVGTPCKRGGGKLFADETQHVLAALSEDRRDLATIRKMQCLAEHGRQRKHRPAEQCSAEDNFDCHWRNRLERLARDARVFHCRSWIELHNAGEVRDRFRARQSQDDADELHPHRAQTFVRRLEKMRGQMRHAQCDQNNDYHRRRQRQRHSEATGMLRPKIIDQPHDQQHANSGERDVLARHFDPFHVFRAGGDVGESGPTAQRRGDSEVGQQQQRAYDRE